MVTAGTYRKQHLFRSRERLAYLHDLLLAYAVDFGWQLQAWAVFSNHYHFVAISPPDANSLKLMLSKLHSDSGLKLNSEDAKQGRQVWFNYWDTRLTFEKSYLARLKYVHTNPVHHGLVRSELLYPWCSANWFKERSDNAFYKTVMSFKVDRVNVRDDFQPE